MIKVIRHLAERQGKLSGGTHTGETCEEEQGFPANIFALGKREVLVEKEILMTYAHVGDAGLEEQIGHASENLIEIDDKVGTAALYLVGDEAYALPVLGEHADVVGQTMGDARTLVVVVGQKVRAVECLHLRADVALEEIGQRARLASSHQYFCHFMSITAKQLLHRDGLGHVASAFTLYNKYYFHLLLYLLSGAKV